MAVQRSLLAALAIMCLSCQTAEAACTRWQAEATWRTGQGERTHTGAGGDKQTALHNARAACAKATTQAAAREVCRTAAPKRQRFLCADGRCIHVAIEDGLGWRAHQGWSREAFCIDRGFDGVIRDAGDDQSGVCYKGACG